jgi:sortase A
VSKKRWIALLSALGIVIAAALTTAAVLGSGDSEQAVDSPLVVAPPTTAKKAPAKVKTTTTTTPLPQPQMEPVDPYADVPVIEYGSIEIPKIGLLHKTYEGIWLTVIDHGPGHWPGSAAPCERGNTVFPGHRVTHSHPFLNIDQLAPGDHIIFHQKGRDCVYSVTGTVIVKPNDVWVTDPTEKPTATIIACHPKHSAAQRIVVKGDLIADIPVPASA